MEDPTTHQTISDKNQGLWLCGGGGGGGLLYERKQTEVANEAYKEILSYVTKDVAFLYF